LHDNSPKENIILHVGRFRLINGKTDDYKKQQVMISAFKLLIDNGLKEWKFIIATSIHNRNDPQFKSMQQSADGYPIEFQINKSNQTLWEIYNKAKIYWHASGYGEDLRAHPEYAEHFGISTVEAMGAGAVPIVISAGGQKEIITDGVNGLLWESLEDLQAHTLKVIKSDKLFTKLSIEAQHRARDFSYEAFCKRVNGLIT
jgi:glycosyltransferase involved in cell wall biosynthesis